MRERIREHCAIAGELAARIEADPGFELAAPVPFSAVCFRAHPADPADPTTTPEERDRFNERLLARVNAAGPFFLSPTVLRGRYTPRVAIGNLKTSREHIDALWRLLAESAAALREEARREEAG
jgi:aromatic-L-amino-acid decarboxylase